MHAIILGPDGDLAGALEDEGFETTHIDGYGTREALAAAGVETADLLVLTDVDEATAVPIAKEANPDIRVVVYADRSMPEFVRGQVDLAVAPDVLDVAVIAEELAGTNA